MTLLLRHRRGLDVLIERSHAIGVHLADTDLAALIGDLHRLPSAVPDVVTVPEPVREIRCASKDGRAPDDWVSRAVGLIHARYRDPELSLSMVAKAAHRSPWHVARTLKSQTGQGFVAHLRDVRVSAARRLLAEEGLSVKEIAVEVGYAHPNRLDRDFMRVCRMTPSSFRSAVASRRTAGARRSPQERVLDRKK